MKKRANVGMVGAGYISDLHSTVLKIIDRAELKMIAGTPSEEEKLKAKAEKFGYERWTTDWRELVQDPNIDLVIIGTPNYTHKEIATAVAEAGKDYIIEKPLALNVEEADEIIKVTRKAGVKAYYAEDLRYAPALTKAKEIIDLGGIGNAYIMRISETHTGPSHSEWFWDAKRTGGGVATDVGIHGLYVIEWLMGARAKEVFARTSVLKWKDLCKNNSEDTAMGLWTFENGALVETIFSWAVSGGMIGRIEIFGNKGTVLLDTGIESGGLLVNSEEGYGKDLELRKKDAPHEAPVINWHFPPDDELYDGGYIREMMHFLDCWQDDKEGNTTIEDGKRALMLVEALYKSAKSGKVEKV